MQMTQNLGKPQYNFYTFLCMLYAIVLAETFILMFKIIHFGSYIASGAVLFIPIMYITEDIITEVYGFRLARRLIWSSLVTSLVFCAMIALTIRLPSPSYWQHQSAFDYVFGGIGKELIFAVIAMVGGEFLNAYLMARWRFLLNGKYFWIRSIIATSIGELFQSIVVYSGNFYGILTIPGIVHLTMTAYVFKIGCALLLSVPGAFVARILQKVEGINIYDLNIKFNPFSKISNS